MINYQILSSFLEYLLFIIILYFIYYYLRNKIRSIEAEPSAIPVDSEQPNINLVHTGQYDLPPSYECIVTSDDAIKKIGAKEQTPPPYEQAKHFYERSYSAPVTG